MSGIAKAVEEVTGQTREQEKAREARETGYSAALSTLSGTGELGKEFTEFGGLALSKLSALLDDPEAIRETSGYQFRLEEGAGVIERGAAAKGGLFSGQTMKELTRYGQEYATQERGAEIQRLAQLAQMGLSGGSEAAKAIANVQIGKGEAEAGARERAVALQQQHGAEIGSQIGSGFSGSGGGQKTTTTTGGGGDEATGSPYFQSEGYGGKYT